MPKIERKKASKSQYIGLSYCCLCGHLFTEEDRFTVVEEDGPYDNDWHAVCFYCKGKPTYAKFLASNCQLPISN